MLLRTKLIMIFFFFIVGCAHKGPLIQFAEPTKQIELGQTKAQVIEILGEPDRKAASYGAEFLVYRTLEQWGRPRVEYFYEFEKSRLVRYGKVSDFQSNSVNVRVFK